MKKLVFFLLIIIPIIGLTQNDWSKSSPLDFAWKYVGGRGCSNHSVWGTSLAFDPTGVPYVAFNEYIITGGVSVEKFDGTNWQYVGYEQFSAGNADYTSLAFSPSGQPYVAFEDYANSKKQQS